MWDKITNFNSRTAKYSAILMDNATTLTSPQDIVNKLAETYEENSSDQNYKDKFIAQKKD